MAEEEGAQRTRVDRRKFLAAAGGTVAAATIGATPAAAAGLGASAKRKWARTVDVVVVGSGAAAYAAAISARSRRQSVVMLEKSTTGGGTTAKSGGAYWILNNAFLKAEGLSDPKEDAIRYMARLSFPEVYNASAVRFGLSALEYSLLETFYDRGEGVLAALDQMGALKSAGGTQGAAPDYHSDLPENKRPYGRTMRPTSGGGAGLIAQVKAYAEGQRIPLLLSHRVTGLVTNSKGQVIGVDALNGSRRVSIRARRAVIFGSGGFTHNTELVRNFLRGPIFGGCAVPTNTGDIIDIAGALGAELGNMNSAWFAQIPFEQAMQFASVPNDIWLPYGDSMIQVNRFGRRVVNEKMVYNERTQAHFYWDPTEREFTNKVLFMVYDAGVASNSTNWPFRYPVPLPGTQSPLVISGSTWAELATNINGRLASHAAALGDFRLAPSWATTMQETIARFNAFAESGKDLDFKRGETAIQVAWHGPPREGAKSNPTMYPFTPAGPYYAIIVAGGTLDTKGGPKINPRAQILNTAGRAIPGLYGAGNCIAGPAGKSYWAAGGTLGPALTFGWIAGENAAREAVKADK